MAIILTDQELINAKRDIEDIGKAVNEKVIVDPRYGDDFKSLPMIADEAQATIGEWESAIALITQEGGVPALAISDASGLTQQQVNGGLESVSDLSLIPSPKNHSRVYVKSYHSGAGVGGGEFIYDAASTETANDVTIFGSGIGRWKRPVDQLITPYHAGAVGDTDASDALDKFAEFVLLNPNLLYDATGDFKISRPWLFDHTGAKTIHWNLRLTAIVPLRFALALEGVNVEHTGRIEVRGGGSVGVWPTFNLDYGVVISGCQGSSLPYISASSCKRWGIASNEDGTLGIPLKPGQSYKNNTNYSIQTVHGRDCGGYNSGYNEDGSGPLNNLGFVARFSNPVRTGSVGVPTQRTVVDVDILPPMPAGEGPVFAVINNRMFVVMESSGVSGGGTISLSQWMPPTWLTGEIKYIFGGAFKSSGPNGGPAKILRLDAIRCGIGIADTALYGATVIQNISQFCGICIAMGSRIENIGPIDSTHIGVYTEAVYRNMVFTGQGAASVFERTGAFSGEPYRNCEKIFQQDSSGDSLSYSDGFARIFMPGRSTDRSLYGMYSKRARNATESSLTVGPASIVDLVYARNSWVINLADATTVNNNSGLDFATLKMLGTGNRFAPIGDFTFNPPAGWTVNSAASAIFGSFYETAVFQIFWDMAAKNIRIVCLSRRGATTAPTAGNWLRGDMVFNTSPAEGGVTGWQCVTSGTPGVWIPFGGGLSGIEASGVLK